MHMEFANKYVLKMVIERNSGITSLNKLTSNDYKICSYIKCI